MGKSTHGFRFVSHMSMGVRLAALRAAGAPLLRIPTDERLTSCLFKEQGRGVKQS